MPQIQLTPAQRKDHRAEAHHLDPVVMIGGDGLTAAVKKETDAALNAHGLIKVRVFSDDRAAREAMFQTLADELNAAPIQHIGKLLVLWRPMPEQGKNAPDEDRMPGPRDVKVLKYSKRGGQRPEVKTLRVLGNQRLTAGGQIKRAKTQASQRQKDAARPDNVPRTGVQLPALSAQLAQLARTSTAGAHPLQQHTSRCPRCATAANSPAPRCCGATANSDNSASNMPSTIKTEPTCACPLSALRLI